jgi:hypothetical protein
MTVILELIQTVEAAGGRFMIDGDRLGIVPANAAAPVMEELRKHKAELLAELLARHSIPSGAHLVRWKPKTAPVELSLYSTVTDTEKFIRTTLAQLEAALKGQTWQSGNWGLSGLLARLEACGCVVVLDNPRRLLQ